MAGKFHGPVSCVIHQRTLKIIASGNKRQLAAFRPSQMLVISTDVVDSMTCAIESWSELGMELATPVNPRESGCNAPEQCYQTNGIAH
jgi:hypothetical protein